MVHLKGQIAFAGVGIHLGWLDLAINKVKDTYNLQSSRRGGFKVLRRQMQVVVGR